MSGLADYPVVVVQPVQWGEMDAYQHVNNVVYFRWFETGRSAYFTAAELWTEGTRGVSPILHSIGCRFKAPLVYPDEVEIGVRVKELKDDRFVIEHAVYSRRGKHLAAIGDGIIVSFDYPTQKKVPLPATWRRAIESVEARLRG